MKSNCNAKEEAAVHWLHTSEDYQPRQRGGASPAQPQPADTVSLDCVLANPKFSRPANDEDNCETSRHAFAPVSKVCREARLIRLWVETLAEHEAERAAAR